MVETPVHIGNSLLIFEIVYIPDPPQDELCTYPLTTPDRQPIIYYCLYFGIVPVDFPDPGQPLLFGEHRGLIGIPPDPDDELVKQRQRTVDNIQVTDCDRIESSRKEANTLHSVVVKFLF